jgi:hypothetical protein
MNKIKKAMAIMLIAGAVGVSYTLYTLRGLPEAFEWEEDDNE